MDPGVWDLCYTPSSGGSDVQLMTRGRKVTYWDWPFEGRMSSYTSSRMLQIRITDLQPYDAGHFEFRDQQGRLALVAELDMPGE